MEKDIKTKYQSLLEELQKFNKKHLVKFVKDKTKLNEEDQSDILFCIFFIFWIELLLKSTLTELISRSQKTKKQYQELINFVFDETSFMAKIKISEFIINKDSKYKKRFKNFFSLCKSLNDIRNQIFHTKFKHLKYKGSDISNVETQRKMLADLIRARLKIEKVLS